MVWPPFTNTLVETSFTLFELVVERLIVTPPGGAGVASVTGMETCCPGAVVTVAGAEIEPETVTFAVVSARFGRLLE